MKNKTTKFLLKILRILPIVLIPFLLINGIETYGWIISILLSSMVSFGLIFWNLFDYEKFDTISLEDFLESTHIVRFNSNDENWNAINEILKSQFVNIGTKKFQECFIEIEIEQKLTNSVLTVERTTKEILLKIEQKKYSFLPDNAKNYRIITNIEKKITSYTTGLSTISSSDQKKET